MLAVRHGGQCGEGVHVELLLRCEALESFGLGLQERRGADEYLGGFEAVAVGGAEVVQVVGFAQCHGGDLVCRDAVVEVLVIGEVGVDDVGASLAEDAEERPVDLHAPFYELVVGDFGEGVLRDSEKRAGGQAFGSAPFGALWVGRAGAEAVHPYVVAVEGVIAHAHAHGDFGVVGVGHDDQYVGHGVPFTSGA